MRIVDWSSDVCSSDLYEELAREARALCEGEYVAAADVGRLRKRLNEVAAIDFFGAHGRQAAQAAITEADRRSHQHPDVSGPGAPELTPAELKRRVWVTRRHVHVDRSEEHTSELQSLMRISYAVFCLKK